MSACFKKIRVTNNNKRNAELEELFENRRILKAKKDENSFDQLKIVENKLAEICAEENAKTIEKACNGLTCEGGGINAGKLWKLKKQLKGIAQEPPSAMLDSKGNLVTSSKTLEKLSLNMYRERLKAHTIKENLKMH